MIQVFLMMLGADVVLAADVIDTHSTTAGIITAVSATITALGGLVLALGVLIPILRATRRVETQTSVIHTIVNQQRTDAQRYNIALSELLHKHGIEPPIDQSLPVIGHEDADKGPSPTRPDNPVELHKLDPDNHP